MSLSLPPMTPVSATCAPIVNGSGLNTASADFKASALFPLSTSAFVNSGHSPSNLKDDSLLDNLSKHFEVRKTKYGGRGCFAVADLPPQTLLLRAQFPVGSAVVRPFRKEVCTWCFHYLDGKTLKFRIDGKVYFCSQDCLAAFEKYDPDQVLARSLCALETLYLKCESKDDDVYEEPANLEQEWAAVAEWEKKVFSIKPSKRARLYPTVNKEDYAEIRYVLGVLYTQYNTSLSHLVAPSEERVETSDVTSSYDSEESLFHLLQSAEQEKVQKYPYLGRSYINIYKVVRLVCASQMLPYVTTQSVRDIIGRNLTNAFGIWSPTTQPGEEREFFGFGVYPSGSFFNHSCAPNVEKSRVGASYDFRTNAAVSKGDELCISYGVSGESLAERRKVLSEWFFCCSCMRCVEEEASQS